MKYSIFPFSILLGMIILISSCSKDEAYEIVFDDADFETTDWTEATHAKGATPDFNEVFADNTVKRLDFVISEERWQAMLDDMTNQFGSFGSGGGRGGLVETADNPIFVPGEVYYNGKQWYKVGLRFKGNSSLQSSWGSGILKLSFKLDFDQFEDEYPQIDNQRFYGFKQLSLKNNFNDATMMREKVGADIFRSAGLASSHTAFYTLYVDHGNGPEYFGVYTLVEEIDNTVIKTQFPSDDGNLYKPDGTSASFANGTFSENDFEKKTNEDESDWTDIINLFEVLHDTKRNTDPAAWRSDLENIFDTDTFLKYLAVNTVIQNWDTYGRMTHNYFLYNSPSTNLLTWIPWDNNEAFQTGNQGGAHTLNFSGLSATNWPLIGLLYADPVYKATYDEYVRGVIEGPFNANTIQEKYTNYATLLEPHAISERSGFTFLSSPAGFQSAVASLKNHVVQRAAAVNAYL